MPSLRDKVKAGVSQRSDFKLVPSKCTLLIIDVQRYLSEHATGNDYLDQHSFPAARENIAKLARAFRLSRDNTTTSSGCEVIWTFLQSATNDRRDISLDYKLSGPLLANIPRANATTSDLFLSECGPDILSGKRDILCPKTSCSVFQSTNIDYMLRNLQIEQLVVVGQLLDQCVESAVRDAADLGYFVTVCRDACAAQSQDAEQRGLQGMNGFARILTTQQVLNEIAAGNPDYEFDEDDILNYLRDKGMESAAGQLQEAFQQHDIT
jgi:nicotinamidase-related amidase